MRPLTFSSWYRVAVWYSLSNVWIEKVIIFYCVSQKECSGLQRVFVLPTMPGPHLSELDDLREGSATPYWQRCMAFATTQIHPPHVQRLRNNRERDKTGVSSSLTFLRCVACHRPICAQLMICFMYKARIKIQERNRISSVWQTYDLHFAYTEQKWKWTGDQ